MKNKTIFTIALATAVMAFIGVSACKKDPQPSNNNNNNTNTADIKPYVIFEGKKFICANPLSLNMIKIAGDSAVEWVGTGFRDTIITILHKNGNIKPGQFAIDTFVPHTSVQLFIQWGNDQSSPDLMITSGQYELKKENGKFVSYLKNGEAYNQKVGHAKRYKNIEFKVVWPY